jgi:hypothetical protein
MALADRVSHRPPADSGLMVKTLSSDSGCRGSVPRKAMIASSRCQDDGDRRPHYTLKSPGDSRQNMLSDRFRGSGRRTDDDQGL